MVFFVFYGFFLFLMVFLMVFSLMGFFWVCLIVKWAFLMVLFYLVGSILLLCFSFVKKEKHNSSIYYLVKNILNIG